MQKSNKKKVSALLCGAALCLALGGTLAYFTDKTDTAASAQAGNINLTWVDKDLTAQNLAQEDAIWEAGFDADGIMNPGDSYDFSYTVANTGNKSIDVKQTLVLVSDEILTGGAEEYTLTILGGNDTTAVVPSSIVNDVANGTTTITYELKDIILDGSIEVDGALGTSTDYSVRLDFSIDALNKFMDSKVSMTYQAYAKQHRNAPDAQWAEVANYEAIQ